MSGVGDGAFALEYPLTLSVSKGVSGLGLWVSRSDGSTGSP